MIARVVTVAFEGVDARRVDVEVQMSSGPIYFAVVGLGDKAVAESRERVRSAFTSIGSALPPMRIIANPRPGGPAQGRQSLRPAHSPGHHGLDGGDPGR